MDQESSYVEKSTIPQRKDFQHYLKSSKDVQPSPQKIE